MIYKAKDVPIGLCIDYMSGNSGLTEEFIYHSLQNSGDRYLVLSGATEDSAMMGEIPMCTINNRPLKVFENKQGLLVARKGKAGKTKYIEAGKYTINDNAYILFVKEDSPYAINLQWLAIQYKNEFLSYSSNSDNGTWNMTGFFEHMKIDIPFIEDQEAIVTSYGKVERLLKKTIELYQYCDDLYSKYIVLDEMDSIEYNLSEVLDYCSRNDCLSEEGIYKLNTLEANDAKIKVLSGTSKNAEYGEISLKSPKIHFINDRQCLHLISRGNAGKLSYLPVGNYATNTNAFLLYMLDDFKEKHKLDTVEKERIYLKFLQYYLQPIFFELSSNSDLGVFPLTSVFSTMKIPSFIYGREMIEFVKTYENLEMLQESIINICSRLESLLQKQIVSD